MPEAQHIRKQCRAKKFRSIGEADPGPNPGCGIHQNETGEYPNRAEVPPAIASTQQLRHTSLIPLSIFVAPMRHKSLVILVEQEARSATAWPSSKDENQQSGGGCQLG